MAPQNLIQQTIVFTSSTGNYDTPVFSAPYMQNVAANSQANTLTQQIISGVVYTGSSYNGTTSIAVSCYVTQQFSQQIQNTLGQLQAQLPMYSIVTYGTNVSYGN